MDDFGVRLELRIDWSEMDLFGHVNNVSYFKYIQAARVNYWETIGLTQLLSENKIGPILASTSCQFLKPLFYPGNITVESRIDYIRNSSFGLSHQIRNQDGETASTATDVIVVYDFEKHTKIQFPVDLREKVEILEGRKF
jgi:acyl-CoA thioester hydrolase